VDPRPRGRAARQRQAAVRREDAVLRPDDGAHRRAVPRRPFIHSVPRSRGRGRLLPRAVLGPGRDRAAVANYVLHVFRRLEEAARRLGPERFCAVKYEELVEQPERELRRVCASWARPTIPPCSSSPRREDAGYLEVEEGWKGSTRQELTAGARGPVPGAAHAPPGLDDRAEAPVACCRRSATQTTAPTRSRPTGTRCSGRSGCTARRCSPSVCAGRCWTSDRAVAAQHPRGRAGKAARAGSRPTA
jgi:hypothetical protein